jgi:hypothetical protein
VSGVRALRRVPEEPVPKEPKPQVFFDSTGWRCYLVSAFNWGFFSLIGVLLASLTITAWTDPSLPRQIWAGPARVLSALVTTDVSSLVNEPKFDPSHPRLIPIGGISAKRYGHFVTWDENSLTSLKRNSQALDVVIGEWLSIAGQSVGLKRISPEKESGSQVDVSKRYWP